MSICRLFCLYIAVVFLSVVSCVAQSISPQLDLTHTMDYTLHRASSSDPTGANFDSRLLLPGKTMTLLDVDGPGMVSHIWMTISDTEKFHLKRLVLRIYWDGEETPSVETPLGDFFGQNLGDYHNFESAMISVGNDHGMNCFFPMPFRKHARITLTNDGHVMAKSVYYNIDYRLGAKTADKDSLYFHAQYRQAQPNHSDAPDFYNNPATNKRINKDGKDNYVFMETTGHGHFVGVTMGVLQNQDEWWGEGDDMFFIDDPAMPKIQGTGAEDYFLGAWDFGTSRFAYQNFGAPIKGDRLAGSRSVVYRFHLDSPIPFTKYFKATIEHGHANVRTDSYYSVAYWYQAEPHAAFPALPAVQDRLPSLMFTGGPGNGPQQDLAPPPPTPTVLNPAGSTPASTTEVSPSGTRTETEPSPLPKAKKPPAKRK